MQKKRFLIEVFRIGETTSRVYNCRHFDVCGDSFTMYDNKKDEQIQISFKIDPVVIDEIIIKIKKENENNDNN